MEWPEKIHLLLVSVDGRNLSDECDSREVSGECEAMSQCTASSQVEGTNFSKQSARSRVSVHMVAVAIADTVYLPILYIFYVATFPKCNSNEDKLRLGIHVPSYSVHM